MRQSECACCHAPAVDAANIYCFSYAAGNILLRVPHNNIEVIVLRDISLLGHKQVCLDWSKADAKTK